MMSTLSKLRGPALAAAILLFVPACASVRTSDQQSCPLSAPRGAHEFGPADASDLAGEYTFIMVATTSDIAGHSVRGRLSLWRPDPNAGPIRTPLGPVDHPHFPAVGALEIDAEPLRAGLLGHPESREPTNPGVRITTEGRMVFETMAGIDAAQLSVEVTKATRDGFRGRWISWGTALVQPLFATAEGYFCAIRVSGGR